MDYLDFLTVPIIVAVVCAVLTATKKIATKAKLAPERQEVLQRFFPLIATVLGVIIGIIIFYSNPALIPATSAFVAIIIGASSGLAATGSNQIIKQLNKFSSDLNQKPKPQDPFDTKKEGGE